MGGRIGARQDGGSRAGGGESRGPGGSDRGRRLGEGLEAAGGDPARVGTAPEDAATLACVHTLRAEGATLQAIADTLTAAGVPTGRGGRWAPATVLGLLRRIPPQARPEVA